MILDVGDTVIVQNSTLEGKQIDEGFATIVKVTNRLDFYMVRFQEDRDNQLYLRYVPTENKV